MNLTNSLLGWVLISRVNSEIKKITNWFRANKMAVNVGKTKYILFRPRGQKINHNLEENGIIYNSKEIGGPVDPNKIFKLGRIHNDHPDKAERMNICNLTLTVL